MDKLRYLDLRGENGHRRYGEIFSGAIRAMAEPRELKPSFFRAREKALLRYPAYCKEIYERAEGAGVDGDLFFAGMLAGVHEFESCTDLFLRRADGAVLYGHNEDGPYAPDNCAIARYSGVRRGFTEFSAAESIPGYTFLWNDAGLVTSVNFIHLERRRYDEPSAHFLLRDAAEASSIEEIREKFSGATCASAFSLNVYDHKTCRAYNVEFLYDQLDILEVTDRYAHANHLIRLGEGYARPGSDTKPRLKSARELLAALDPAAAGIGDVRKILEYVCDEEECRSVYSAPGTNEFITGATMLVDPANWEIIVADRFSGEEMRFKLPRA